MVDNASEKLETINALFTTIQETISGWVTTVTDIIGTLEDIEIKWPEVPNPFVGVQAFVDALIGEDGPLEQAANGIASILGGGWDAARKKMDRFIDGSNNTLEKWASGARSIIDAIWGEKEAADECLHSCTYSCVANTGDSSICEASCTVEATDGGGCGSCTADTGSCSGGCTLSTGSGGVPVEGDDDFIGPPCDQGSGGGGGGTYPDEDDDDFIGPCSKDCSLSDDNDDGGGGGGGTYPDEDDDDFIGPCSKDCSLSNDNDDSGGCGGKPDEYASGGYVDRDGGTVHKGEWVIPTQGGPVLTGGRDIAINLTYNIAKITGVEDFERTLEAHDRELFRQLRALI